MPLIHLNVPQSAVDEINADLSGIHGRAVRLSAAQIGREALAVFKWSVGQVEQGRAVVSMDAWRACRQQIATDHLPAKAPRRD